MKINFLKEWKAHIRAWPVIELHGTPLYADAQWSHIYEVGNPDNRMDRLEAVSFPDYLVFIPLAGEKTEKVYRPIPVMPA